MLPRPDDLSKGYAAALVDLHNGKERRGIADRLASILEKHPESRYVPIVRPFLIDLAESASRRHHGLIEPPEKLLSETRIEHGDLVITKNWSTALTVFMEENKSDFVTRLAAEDRVVITRLIPLLTDRSPARCDPSHAVKWIYAQPRVFDLACELIEYQARFGFTNNSFTSKRFRRPNRRM